MLSNSRNLVRLASRHRNGSKILAAVSQSQTKSPVVQNKIESNIHTHVDKNVRQSISIYANEIFFLCLVSACVARCTDQTAILRLPSAHEGGAARPVPDHGAGHHRVLGEEGGGPGQRGGSPLRDRD